MTNSDAFRDRRVLITGHTGFKGSWLSIWLHALGARVSGYALAPPTTPNMFDAANVAGCVIDHRGDIRDATAIRKVVEEFDPEIVFHLAAQAIVGDGYREPVETYAVNVVGTAAVLDACRHAPSLRAVVVVTSDKCYENKDWLWGYRENDRLGGYDPYSSSKACAELVTDAFRRSYLQDGAFSVGVATARAGNVIGGGDWAQNRLVPDLARAAATGRAAVIRNPRAVRPWQHVLEPLAGYISLAEHLLTDPKEHSGSWNFGPSPKSMQSVEVVANELGAIWEGRLNWSIDDRAHPYEAARLLLDSSKAASMLCWRRRLTLRDAIRYAAGWYDAHWRGQVDMRRFTEAQIAAYAAATTEC